VAMVLARFKAPVRNIKFIGIYYFTV